MPERDRTEVVTSRAALDALEPEWDRLAEVMAHPMLSHAWISSCARTLHADDPLYIITVYRNDRLAGVAPLVARARAGVTRLELIGAAALYEPSGVLYAGDDVRDELLRAMVNSRRPALLARVASGDAMRTRLSSLGRGIVLSRRVAASLAVPIASGWDTYVASLSPRRRSDLRRARRRAEEAGSVRLRLLSPRPDDVDGMFADLVRVEAAGWKGRHGSSLSQRYDLRAFFLHYARRASQAGLARFAFLDVDGTPVAAQLSVEYAERLWVLKIGYDERWSRSSPGWQLLAETMRDAFERKLRSYEFLGSDEPWLHGWNTELRPLDTVAWYPATASGLFGLAADTALRVRDRVATTARGRRA